MIVDSSAVLAIFFEEPEAELNRWYYAEWRRRKTSGEPAPTDAEMEERRGPAWAEAYRRLDAGDKMVIFYNSSG